MPFPGLRVPPSRSARKARRGDRYAVLLASAAFLGLFPVLAEAQDRRIKIINESTHDIVGFYSATVDTRDWPESMLGSEVLSAGASIVLDFEDGSGYCRYRFRAVFGDGAELVRPSVNVCEIGTYRYTD